MAKAKKDTSSKKSASMDGPMNQHKAMAMGKPIPKDAKGPGLMKTSK